MATKEAIARANQNYNKKRNENTTTIRLPNELHAKLKERAAKERCTMIEFISKLLDLKVL